MKTKTSHPSVHLRPPHDRTHISCQVPAAGGGGQVFLGIQAVGVDHEVPVSQVSKKGDVARFISALLSLTPVFKCVIGFSVDEIVHFWGLGFVFPIEELWKGTALDGMNTGGRKHKRMTPDI